MSRNAYRRLMLMVLTIALSTKAILLIVARVAWYFLVGVYLLDMGGGLLLMSDLRNRVCGARHLAGVRCSHVE
jgi:hypothetical protein